VADAPVPVGDGRREGPPAGSVLDSPRLQHIPMSTLEKLVERQLGTVTPSTTDPGFQPPFDALQTGDPKGSTRKVYRDIPIINIATTWTPQQVQGALASHSIGVFDFPGMLADSILGDDRVQATMASRCAALFGREPRFKPANDSAAAKECCDAWADGWKMFSRTAVMTEMHAYAILMGFEIAQLVWDTTGPIWRPEMRPWHPRYTYYHWPLRRYVALSQDGQVAVEPGNAKWVLHAPYGSYRGWIRGAIRAVAEPWLIRHFAIRDWARFSEVHGLPIRKAIVPAAAAEDQRDRYQQQLATLGNETTIMVSHGVDGLGLDYDLELVEAKDTAWESFPGLRDHCDMAIVLALMMQNLTTEVQGGAFAATKSHMDVRQDGTEFDNDAWASTIYAQVARPFAFLNFGDAELAPWTDRDCTPKDDLKANAAAFQHFGASIANLAKGGVQFTDPEQVKKFAADRLGLKGLPDMTIKPPVQPAGGGGGGGWDDK
jgi:phage gp29-like protein